MIDEIRLHLSARRPGGEDDSDPAIAAALAKAAESPEVAAWADAERRSDAALAEKLRQVQPPPGLRDTILAGARVSRRRWWHWFNERGWRSFRNSELLAVAATVLILGVALAWNSFQPEERNSDWQKFATTEVAKIEAGEMPLDFIKDSLPEIHDFLVQHTCPTPEELPEVVRKMGISGCKTDLWRGQPVSIVCFKCSGGREVHLVTISRNNLPASPPTEAPVFRTINGYMTASWSKDDKAMMLVGKLSEAEFREFFAKPESTAQLEGARDHALRLARN